MEDPRQLMRYLTIEDILIIAESQVGNYQFLHKEQLDYLVDAVRAKFGDVELYPTLETNPRNYELSAGGFLAEIDRMNLEVAEYLSVHSSKLIKSIVDTVHLKPDDVLF